MGLMNYLRSFFAGGTTTAEPTGIPISIPILWRDGKSTITEDHGYYVLWREGFPGSGYTFLLKQDAELALDCITLALQLEKKERLRTQTEAEERSRELERVTASGIVGQVDWCPHDQKYWNQMCLECWTTEAGTALVKVPRLTSDLEECNRKLREADRQLAMERERLTVCLVNTRTKKDGFTTRRQIDAAISRRKE